MSLCNVDADRRLQSAKRAFSLIPVFVFVLALVLLVRPVGGSPYEFLQLLLRVVVTSLTSCFVCIAAYGFYRYLVERSPGL